VKIDPAQHGWMTAPETVQVMAALGEARFVGGAVRNALLGVPVVDIDIAVPMPPQGALTRLKAKGITTLILTGWKISGSVTYTSVGATLRGYTCVVPIDATSDATDYEIVIGKYQILNQNSANATNEPLKAKASTLSRTDMITFQ